MTRFDKPDPDRGLFKCLKSRPMAHLRLICFPHAGAGVTVYRPWLAMLPPSVEVFALQLPGREDRLNEDAFTSWPQMIETMTAAIDGLPNTPVALFGHSLGAVIALAAARRISAQNPTRLAHCFFSGRCWPGEENDPSVDISALSDEEFLQMMARRYGDAGAAMDNADIRALTLPVLRSDVALLLSYVWQTASPLACPVTIFSGTEDPSTTDRDLTLWQKETRGTCAQFEVEGGHLFHIEQQDTVLGVIRRQLGLFD